MCHGMRITAAEADQILASDLAAVELDVNHFVKVPINQNQFDVLVTFDFNCRRARSPTTAFHQLQQIQ